MKKRNLGRIAALGLAGLTAIPAISIVASADVTRTSKTDDDGFYSLTGGPAYKVTWKVKETTYTYSYDRSNTVNGYTATSAVDTVNNSSLEDTKYFATKTAADAYAADHNVNKNSDWAKKNTALDNELDLFKQKCLDFAWYENNNKAATETISPVYTVKSNYLNEGLSIGDKVQFYKDADKSIEYGLYKVVTVGTTTTYVEVTPTTDAPAQLVGKKRYTNITTASAVSISLSQIMSESNSSFASKTDYEAKNEILPYTDSATKPSSSEFYKLAKSSTGGNGTTTTPGVGNYGQYVIPSVYRYASSVSYFSYDTSTWYPNTSAFYYAVGYYPNSIHAGSWTSKTPTFGYTSLRCWFDPTDGNYYTANDAGAYAVLVNADNTVNHTESYVYKSSTTGLYYLSWSAANNATSSNGTITAIGSIPTYAAFFSMSDGKFYSTYEAALSASSNISGRVIAVNGATTNYINYLDPYYYYYLNGSGLTRPTSDTSAVTIGNRKGWTNVVSYAQNAKSGASYNVSMNGETVVPSSVLSAIKGRNVTMNFTLKNGVVYSINGYDVSSAKELDIDTTYNTKNIPSKLISKAKSKNDGVSTSQLSIDGGSFGSSADVTVKFATKRAGCTARLYRYNADRNSLSLVSKSSVGSNGKCTFDDVTKGGDYVIVLS